MEVKAKYHLHDNYYGRAISREGNGITLLGLSQYKRPNHWNGWAWFVTGSSFKSLYYIENFYVIDIVRNLHPGKIIRNIIGKHIKQHNMA